MRTAVLFSIVWPDQMAEKKERKMMCGVCLRVDDVAADPRRVVVAHRPRESHLGTDTNLALDTRGARFALGAGWIRLGAPLRARCRS